MSDELMVAPSFTVCGAGLAGTLAALYLARQGNRVTLYERLPDMRTHPVPRGRSINLALSRRGLHALEALGLAPVIHPLTIPMRGRMIHSPQGELTFQPYGRTPEETIFSISRHQLNCALLDAAAHWPNLEIHFQSRCTRLHLSSMTLEIEDTRTRAVRQVSARTVVGADGAFSAVRQALQRTDRYDYAQTFLPHGYKELTIPALPGGQHALEKNYLHIWPRQDFMLIALPNLDGSFTCTLFLAHEGAESFASLTDEDAIRRFFDRHFPDVTPLMPTLVEDFQHNPTGSMVTIRCFPWQYAGRVVLVGDAAHAVVPFYGQGMNASFEDCFVLDECLRRHNGDTGAAFLDYQQQRKVNTDALAELAYENYLEMRAKVASPWFLMRRRLEYALSNLLGDRFLPLYTMVSFTRIPYAEARARAARQDRWLDVALATLVLLVLLALLWWLWPAGR
ncbi:NAD(P)/FAD-dependent oxidoreductase [Chloracidobacterium thermophilum]|uniref:FAD-dependent oxidoreductase n=1 Tax=Chloracidobacterium thermophilum TaxID=458033 RepID=UPI000738BD39|nr:NAD(P)/FAD-dependent oxidoreductase [Chloracidobacterium thermophilum]